MADVAAVETDRSWGGPDSSGVVVVVVRGAVVVVGSEGVVVVVVVVEPDARGRRATRVAVAWT